MTTIDPRVTTPLASSCLDGRYDCGHITRSSSTPVKRAAFLHAAEERGLGFLGGRHEAPEVLAALALMRVGASCREVLLASTPEEVDAFAATLVEPARPTLGAQQVTLLGYVSEGLSFPEAADLMGLSVETVRSHAKRAMRATATHSIVDAAVEAAALGLI